MNIFRFLILLLFLATPIAHAQQENESKQSGNWWNQNIWSDPDRGFYWYPPDRPLDELDKLKKKDQAEAQKPKTIYEMTTSKEVHEELNRILDVAIFNPSESNLYEYQKAKAWVMEKASIMADVGRRVTWKNQDIDYNAKIPFSSFGRYEMEDQRNKGEKRMLSDLSKTYGILFFYRSDCPYCHKQAPTLLELQKRHGLETLAISIDGGPMEGFPDAKPDNGIAKLVTNGQGIATVPALYLVSNDKKTVVPIGTGILALEEIIDRIYVLTQTKPGSSF